MISILLLTLLFIVSYLGFWQGRDTEKYYTSKPIYISHRGVTKNNPENTIGAFKEAESLGFQGIEVDIIASKDGVLYCSHNHHLNQETNHSGYIDQMLSDELDNINTGFFSHPNNQQKVPRLNSVIENISNDMIINIEIKFSSYFDLSTAFALRRFLKNNKTKHRILVSSFNPLIVFFSRWLIPSTRTGFLFENANMIKWINFCHPDTVHPRIDFLDEDIIKRCKAKNLPINVWTVNSETSIEKCENFGVDGIITDLEKF